MFYTNNTLLATIDQAIDGKDRDVFFCATMDDNGTVHAAPDLPEWLDTLNFDHDSDVTQLTEWVNDRITTGLPTTMLVRSYIAGDKYQATVQLNS